MHFPKEDAPALKKWIVERLGIYRSDADPDVLADFVLALLTNHENDEENGYEVFNDASSCELFEADILDFIGPDTKAFTNDVVQAIKHRSYIPGARPPPELPPSAAAPLFFATPNPMQPYNSTGPAAAGRKRGFQDRDDTAPDRYDQSQNGGRAFKQPRRGGGRKGYVDPDRPQPAQDLSYEYNPRTPGLSATAPSFAPLDMASFGPGSDPMEAMRKLQEIQQQIGILANFNNFPQQQAYPPQRQPQRRRGRCRDYDNKGYCQRGHNCMYEHSNDPESMLNNLPAPQMSGQIRLPQGGQFPFDFYKSSSDFKVPSFSERMESRRLKPAPGQGSMPLPDNPLNPNLIPLGPVSGMSSASPDSIQSFVGGGIAPHTGDFQAPNFFPYGYQPGSGNGHFRNRVVSSSESAIPGLGLFESRGDGVSLNLLGASSPITESAMHRNFGRPHLTDKADVQPSIGLLVDPSYSMASFSSMFGDAEMDHDRMLKTRRDNRQGPPRNKAKSAANRAPFSQAGPMRDKSRTAVVVENIPEECFDEQQVRDFFVDFGTILEVTMMPYKRLAVVKYDNWNSAQAAYNSPKVIFNNRFVKVFWFRKEEFEGSNNDSGANGIKKEPSERNGFHATAESEEPAIDMEEFKRQQEQAQKIHEEKTLMKHKLAEQQAELEAKLKAHEAEKQKLMAKLAEKNGSKPGANGTVVKDESDPSKKPTQTDVLRATLAKLQEEAKSFGLDPNAPAEDDATISIGYSEHAPYTSYHPRGRGGYFPRARGSYAPRGSYRGVRGGAPGGRGNIHAAYAVYSLDNRPKKVALTGVDFSVPEKDEALRQHLFSLGEFSAEIQVTPAKTLVSFSDRKAAEKFFSSVSAALPAGDKAEATWVANTAGPLAGVATSKIESTNGNSTNGASAGATAADESLDAVMADPEDSNGKQPNGQPQQEGADDEDYDVAGDNEWDIS